MKKMTVKQYALKCGISVQAANKRLKNLDNYPEIVYVEKINKNFSLLTINPSKGYTKKATTLQN